MLTFAIMAAAASASPIAGTWEGSSLCQVKPSPCHDEHVIYRIRSSQSRHYSIDAYKLVAGKEDFMGTISVALDAGGRNLDGPVIGRGRVQGRLQLAVKGAHMTGRMLQSNGTLYRLIELDKH